VGQKPHSKQAIVHGATDVLLNCLDAPEGTHRHPQASRLVHTTLHLIQDPRGHWGGRNQLPLWQRHRKTSAEEAQVDNATCFKRIEERNAINM
jgi:hypothetical protein